MTTIESRYVEYTYGNSDKFYRVVVTENAGTFTTTVTWGRRGTAGQQQDKYHGPSREAALAALARAYAEKTGKGYVDARDPLAAATASRPTPAPTSPVPTAQRTPSAAPARPVQAVAPATAGVPRFPAQKAGENNILDRVLANPAGFVMEEKFDGFRALVTFNPGGGIEIRNTYGEDKGKMANAPHIERALRSIVTTEDLFAGTVLDGELIGPSLAETNHLLGGAGRTDPRLRFMVFDLPYFAGRDLRNLPWAERRKALERLLANMPAGPVQLVPTIAPARGVVEAIWARGGEGVIIKDITARYMPGDRNSWTKVKERHTAEAVIVDLDEGNGKYAGKVGAVVLAQYRGGRLTEVCRVSGMTDDVRNQIDQSWIGRVIEFEYQRKTDTGSYRHPRWLRVRADKKASDCSWEGSA